MRYGHALNFNRVTKFNETEYDEVFEKRFEPLARKKIQAALTFNKAEKMVVIDSKIRRRKTRANRR